MIVDGPKPPVTKWSFSALTKYEKCPFSIYLSRVERCKEPPMEDDHPMIRGNRIHKEAEDFVMGTGALTPALSKFKDEFLLLKESYEAGNVEIEQNWGFTRDWAPVSWNDDDCWAMIKCDVVEHLEEGRSLKIIDHKTGKKFGKEVPHMQQTQLYAIAGFMRYPKVQNVEAGLWYVDEGKTMSRKYDRSMLAALLPKWDERASKLTKALVFKPKPNKGNCRFCPFGTNVGTGDCAYAVPFEG